MPRKLCRFLRFMRKDIRIIKIILAKYEHCVTIESGFLRND